MADTTATIATSDYELERGKPMPDKNHAIIQGRLTSALDRMYGNRYSILPEINLDLPIRSRVPDLAIYPPIAFDPDNNEVRMTEPPLCAVEILSELQSPYELMKKRSEYFLAGVKSYWMVLPGLRTVYVFRSPEDYDIFSHRDRLVDQVLDIELDLGEIFR